MDFQSQQIAGLKRPADDFQDEVSSFNTRWATRKLRASSSSRNGPIDLTGDDEDEPSVSVEENSTFRTQHLLSLSTNLMRRRWGGFYTKDEDEHDYARRRSEKSTSASPVPNLGSHPLSDSNPNRMKPKLNQKLLEDAMSIDFGCATDCTVATLPQAQSSRTQPSLKPKKKSWPPLILSNGEELRGLTTVPLKSNSLEKMASNDPSPGKIEEMSAVMGRGNPHDHQSSLAISNHHSGLLEATSSSSPKRGNSEAKDSGNSEEPNSGDVEIVKATIREGIKKVTSYATNKPDEGLDPAAVETENSTPAQPTLMKVKNATRAAEGKQVSEESETLSKDGSSDEAGRKRESAAISKAQALRDDLSQLSNTEAGTTGSHPPTANSIGSSSSNTKPLTEKKIKEITSQAAKERRRKEAQAKNSLQRPLNGQATKKLVSKSAPEKRQKYGFKVREYDHLILKLREKDVPFAKIAQKVSDKYPHLPKLSGRNANYRYKKAKAALVPDGSESGEESEARSPKASSEIPSTHSSLSFPSLLIKKSSKSGSGDFVQRAVQHSRAYTTKRSNMRRSSSFEVQTFPRVLPWMNYGIFTNLAVQDTTSSGNDQHDDASPSDGEQSHENEDSAISGAEREKSTLSCSGDYAPTPNALNFDTPEPQKSVAVETAAETASTGRQTIGKKSLSPKAYKLYLESLSNLPVDSELESAVDPDEDESLEPEIGVTSDDEIIREESPATDCDRYHWEYSVKRKSWRREEDENQAQWYCVGQTGYSSLTEANLAAGQEILRERDGFATAPYARDWRRTLDEFDMANYFVELADGYFRVHVDRVLRNRFTGRLPDSKAGWLKKTVWDIMQKTTIEPSAIDQLFDETGSNEQTTIEVVDGIFTILDEANREAGSLAIALRVPYPENSLRIEHQLKRQDARKEINARLDELEQRNETFKEIIKVSETKAVEIWVQARTLKGPRNI
jgi:hypothetical protein